MIVDASRSALTRTSETREPVFDNETFCDGHLEHLGALEPDFWIGFVVREISGANYRIIFFSKGVTEEKFFNPHFPNHPDNSIGNGIRSDGKLDSCMFAIFQKWYEV